MLAYVVFSLLLYSEDDEIPGMSSMIAGVMFYVLHALVNLILMIVAFTRSDKERGQAYGLSALLIAVIGFSACSGIMNT